MTTAVAEQYVKAPTINGLFFFWKEHAVHHEQSNFIISTNITVASWLQAVAKGV